MAKIKVQINLNMKKYGLTFADRMAQLAAAEVVTKAREYVAHPSSQHPYSQGDLRNSIKQIREGFAKYLPYAETEYARAQEWGRPDLPNYTFTPYMRPAAAWAKQAAQMQKYITRAEEAALRIAAVKT